MNIHTATETAYKNDYAQGVADTRAKFSTIYVLHFSDQENYALIYSLLCPVGTIGYWIYKLCTAGRR